MMIMVTIPVNGHASWTVLLWRLDTLSRLQRRQWGRGKDVVTAATTDSLLLQLQLASPLLVLPCQFGSFGLQRSRLIHQFQFPLGRLVNDAFQTMELVGQFGHFGVAGRRDLVNVLVVLVWYILSFSLSA